MSNEILQSNRLHHPCSYIWIEQTGAHPGVEIGGGHMASAEREPIMGVWGLCPQRGPGAEPLVRGRSPPEAEHFLVLLYVWNGAKLQCLSCFMVINGSCSTNMCARQLSFNFSSTVFFLGGGMAPWPLFGSAPTNSKSATITALHKQLKNAIHTKHVNSVWQKNATVRSYNACILCKKNCTIAQNGVIQYSTVHAW